MRNKKIFTIILLSVIILYSANSVKAKEYASIAQLEQDLNNESFIITSEETTYEDPVCTNNDGENTYTLKWNKEKRVIGAIYATYNQYESKEDGEPLTGEYGSRNEAQAAIDGYLKWSKPACCTNTDPKDGMCSGSVCNKPTCTIEDVVSASGNCRCGKASGKVINDDGKETTVYEDQTDDGTCLLTNGGYSCLCKNGKTQISTANCKTVTKYRIKDCQKTKAVPTGPEISGERNLYTFYYTMNIKNSQFSGDEVYCVQPGAHGPGENGELYKIIQDYNISECRDQFTRYNKDANGGKGAYERATQCGLAHIMYEAYNYDVSTGKFTTLKGTYSPEALTLALRLWLAAYGRGTDGPGLGSGGAEEAIIGFVPKEDYYTITASKIKNGGTYNTSNEAITAEKVKGRIGCSTKEPQENRKNHKCVIDQAIELFHKTEKIKKEEFLGGHNFIRKSPVVTYEEDKGFISITMDDSETYRIVKEKCKNINDPGCILEPHFYIYLDGKLVEVTDIVLKPDGENFCNKNTCRYIPEGIKERCLKGADGVKLVLIFKNWNKEISYINFYNHASKDNYQIMVSIANKLEDCYQKGKSIKKGRLEVEIPCSCDNKCTDLSSVVKSEKEGVCNPKKTISDASMSCITHACDPKEAAIYDVTSQYDVDPLVCTIYEREDNDIHMPEATSVYSGMQFSYDIGAKLKNKGINVVSNKKLTSVIVQKRQLTSNINYDYWEAEYIKKINLLKKAYDNYDNYSNEYRNTIKKDVSNWVYTLRNCNLAGKINTSDSRIYAVDEMDRMIDNIVNCTGVGCKSANLAVEYEDAKYGSRRNLAVERNLIGSEQYYCHGTDCYKYPSTGASTEPKMTNSTVNLTYYNCSGKTCSTTSITIPNNTYATKVYSIEHDYYNDKKYSAQAYTGAALEEGAVTSNSTSTPLSDYSYPISGSTKTNTNGYGVKFHYSNITNKKLKDFTTDEKCIFKVYNRTTAYDCKITDSKGNVDLSKCEDTSYKVVNGIAEIDENQINWVLADKKQYGYVFRNIDLSNPFPNGLENRTSVINWTNADIEAIKATANNIFTYDEYLEYSYTLPPLTIKEIVGYNDRQLNSGGYLNNTLEDCTIIKDDTGLSIFTECKSNFLHGELKNYPGIVISGNKAGVN